MTLDKTMEYLNKHSCSIVVSRNDEILYTSNARGIAPIYELYTTAPELLKDSLVADKVIGRGAAMFLVEAGVAGIYGKLMSRQALQVIPDTLEVGFDTLCDFIKNRDQTGRCPVETLSLETQSVDTLEKAVAKFLDTIGQGV